MHERMNEHSGHYQNENAVNQDQDKQGGVGEYIDFEEIKDWVISLFLRSINQEFLLDP